MKADLLLYNGKIHTLDPKTPVVSAIAIDGDAIVAMGNDKLQYQFDDAVEKIDLQQKVVTPGMGRRARASATVYPVNAQCRPDRHPQCPGSH